MFIKVKRALYSTSCIYSSHTHTQHPHTHTHTHTLSSHSLSPSIALLLSQAVCPHGNEGCSNNNNNACKVINTLCKTATKKKKKAKHSEREKKTKAANWVGQGCQSGWVGALALGACLFLCRVVTAAASSFCSLLLLLPLPLPRSPSLLLRVASHFLH